MVDGFPFGLLPDAQSPYWIAYPLDIRQQFRQLAKRGERVMLWHGPGASVVSTVLEVDAGLLLDVGPDARTNERLLALPEIVLTGFLDGVELKCPLGPLQWATHDGLPAFAAPLPARLHRLQRREFHRMPIPAGHSARCEFPQPGGPPLAVSLHDLSLGGVGLIDPGHPALKLDTGSVWRDCRIVLHEAGAVAADLEVRHTETHTTRSGQTRRKVGCRFLQLSAGASPLLQRYLTQLELDRRALTGG